jgi:hypothetical protein
MKPLNQQPGVAPLAALVLAWLVPGLGHLFIGRKVRGIVILVTVLVTFWAGIAVGGVMTVDYRSERWWFAADMLTGVHGLIGWQRSEAVNRRVDEVLAVDRGYMDAMEGMRNRMINAQRQGRAGDMASYTAEVEQVRNQFAGAVLAKEGLALVAPFDTVARAFCGITGLLNLMCIFDALILAQMAASGGIRPGERMEAAR